MNIPINNTSKNLQWIDLIFKNFVERSLELEGYGFGNIDQINSKVLEYPYLWVDPDRSRLIRNASPKSGFSAIEVEIEVIVADKLRSDVENEVETISDVNEIILSAIAELSQHPYYVKNNVSLSRDVDIVNEWRRNDDIVNRAVARLTLRWAFSYTYCAEPIIYGTASFPYIPSSPVPSVSFCEAVKACVGDVEVGEEVLYDYVELLSGNFYLYIGKAPKDSLTSENVWSIVRTEITPEGTTTALEAENVAWDDRETVPYT